MSLNFETAMEYLDLSPFLREDIHQAYSQPDRTYHNIQHLNDMLRWIPQEEFEFKKELVQAVVFHDYVYEKFKPTGYNESQSLVRAALAVLLNQTKMRYEIVVEAINATAYHDRDQLFLSPTTKLLLDLDLQSFAQPRDEFLKSSHNVLLEFDPKAGLLVREGNRKFLETLLKRKKLYYVKTEWEEPARENLAWRIENMHINPAD